MSDQHSDALIESVVEEILRAADDHAGMDARLDRLEELIKCGPKRDWIGVLSGSILGLLLSRADEALRRHLGAVKRAQDDGLQYVWIPPGSFLMGALPGDKQAYSNERPRHRVDITKGFWISRGPVTVAAYKRFGWAAYPNEMSDSGLGEYNTRDDSPVVCVPLRGALKYGQWVGGGRLPTEAEWEYAARGGRSNRLYPWGNNLTFGNPRGGGNSRVRPNVGRYPCNGFGLFDMGGLVYETCSDWYEDGYYSMSPTQDPTGPLAGTEKVMRGCSWNSVERQLRCSYRKPDDAVGWEFGGFRCVRERIP